MREYDFEPVRGLPEQFPPGEDLLWQGTPRWTALARRAFHVRKVAIYFAVLVVWRIVVGWSPDVSTATALQGASWVLLLGALSVGALTLLAWAMARSTVYTITNQRVVIRFGVALPMILNLPFKQIRSAGFKHYADGTGDIPLLLAESARPSYLIFWPHVRPWHFAPPEPMLRVIPDAPQVAEILVNALKAYTEAAQASDEPLVSTDETETDESLVPRVVSTRDL